MNSKRTPACGTATAPSKLDGLALLAAVSEAVLFTHDEPPSTTGKPVLPPLESMATTATTTATTATKPQKAIPSSHGAVPPLLSLAPYTVSEKLYPNPAVLFEAAMVEPRDTFSQAYKLMTLSHSPVHSPASPTASSLSSTDPASSPQSHFVFDKPTHASNGGNDATATNVSDCACCNHSEAEESDGRAVASSDDEEEEEEDAEEEYFSDSDAFATSAPHANSAHWPSSPTGSPYPRRVSHRTVRPSPRRHPKAEPTQTTLTSPTSAIARPSSAAVPILPPIIKRCSNGKKLHVCPYCSREFSCSSNLKRHTSIHTGVKPYKCSTCGMAFSNSSNRRKHERTHAKATKSNTAYSADVPVALSAARLNAPSPSSFPKKPSSNRALRAARRKTGSPRQ